LKSIIKRLFWQDISIQKQMKQLFVTLLFSALYFGSFAQFNIDFISNLKYPGKTLANLWGYTDASGNEYALVGHTEGLSIVDLSDPVNPVEIHFVNGANSTWREVRTWQDYAYVTTEGGGGVTIVDLSNLPASINTKSYAGNGPIANQLNSVHALHIDDGYLYLYGSNLFNGGLLIISLSDPWNPTYAGNHSQYYVHDGIVRNNIAYPSHIYNGFFSVIDVSNKANPVMLETQNTPNNFTHNTWLSDDNKTLFTTDEVNNSFLAAYDVSDYDNIKELGKVQMNPGSNSVVHNTYILNDFAVTSWYKDGVVIVDGSRPSNLVITGHYDTSPLSGGGMNGCWGVYPYFPSGRIIASDMEQGLFVLNPTYVRASYLEGIIIDSSCGIPLNNVTVSIVGAGVSTLTGFTGKYATGTPQAGTYDISFSSPGYQTKTISGVNLSTGNVTTINLELYSPSAVAITGTIKDDASISVPGAYVQMNGTNAGYNFLSDVDGEFTRCNVIPGTYEVTVGKWNYVTICNDIEVDAQSIDPQIELVKGIYDDFTFNFGWTVSGDASAGIWERGKPIGTFNGAVISNPHEDVSEDCSYKAFVTGNGGGSAGFDDIDDGRTVLTSPLFDLSAYSDPYVHYYRWFYNGGGGGSTPNDSLTVRLHNGTLTVPVEIVTVATPNSSTWVRTSIRVKDFIVPTSNMRISFDAVDANPGHLVEAAVDKFEVTEGINNIKEDVAEGKFRIYPNPFNNQFLLDLSAMDTKENSLVRIFDISGRMVFENTYPAHSGKILINTDFNGGVYFLHLQKGNKHSVPLKLIKTK
jgi:choice-of-anchor B domain-containing protein